MRRVTRLIAASFLVLVVLGCSKTFVNSPGTFQNKRQSPQTQQSINQKLLDNALGEATTQLDFTTAQNRKVFIEIDTEYRKGIENVRFAVAKTLQANGVKGIVTNTSDADVLVSVNPSVYDYQLDTLVYNGFLWFTSKWAVKQTASVKLTAILTDMRSGDILSISSGEAYSTLEGSRKKVFWFVDLVPRQRTHTLSGSALDAHSTY